MSDPNDFGIVEDQAPDAEVVPPVPSGSGNQADDFGIIEDAAPEPIVEPTDYVRKLAQPDPDELGRLQHAFDEAQAGNQERALTVFKLSKALNVESKYIEPNLEQFKATAAAVNFDPLRWAQENPRLRDVVLNNPDAAHLVVNNKELTDLVKVLNKVSDIFGGPMVEPNEKRTVWGKPGEEHFVDPTGQVPDSTHAEYVKANLEGQAVDYVEQQKARIARDAPKQVLERQDAKSQVLANDPSLAGRAVTLIARAQEAQAGLESSKLAYRAMLQELQGKDATATWQKRHDLEVANQPRAYGEGPWMQRASQAVTGMMSTVDTLKDTAEAAGVVGAAGAVVGAGVGVLDPQLVGGPLGGARIGAGIGARLGGGFGAFAASTVLETGSLYPVLRATKTDSGRLLTQKEAAGAAILGGVLNGGLEMLELNALAKTLAPAKETLSRVTGATLEGRLVAAVRTDPKFRALLVRVGEQWLESTLVETGEEGAQHVVGAGVTYAARSKADKAWQKGDVLDLPGAIEEMGQALPASALMAGGGSMTSIAVPLALQLGSKAQAVSDAQNAAKRAPSYFAMAANETVQGLAEPMARVIAETSGEHGTADTHAYVSGEALSRRFQEVGPAQARTEMLDAVGEDGPRLAAEAIATGGRLEIPMPTFLEKWGQSDIGKALQQDTAFQPAHMTPRELAAGGAERIEKDARAIADAEIAKGLEKVKENQAFDALEQEMLASTRHLAEPPTATQVKALRRIHQAFWSIQAGDFGHDLQSFIGGATSEFRVKFGVGDEATIDGSPPINNASDLFLRKRLAEIPAADQAAFRAQEHWVDPLSGLQKRRMFDAIPVPEGMQVARIDLPDAKGINDHPTHGGHGVANDVLRVAGRAVADEPGATRSGTALLFHAPAGEAGQAVLEAAKARVQAAVGPNVNVVGLLGPNANDIGKSADTLADDMRKAGTLPARGELHPALDVAALKYEPTPAEQLKRVVPDALAQKTAAMTPEEYAAATYDDAIAGEKTGLYTIEAWDALPRKAHTVALDGEGVRKVNDRFGKEVGDQLLQAMARALNEAAGKDFNTTHRSGDEFCFEGDNPNELKAVVRLAQKAARELDFEATDPKTGEQVRVAVRFRYGYGDNYALADRDLNERKRLEKTKVQAGEQRDGAGGVRPDGQPGASGGEDTGVLQGSGGQAAVAEPGVNEHNWTPQDMAKARAFAARARVPGKAERINAFLDYAEGKRERPVGKMALDIETERKLMYDFDVYDPKTGGADLLPQSIMSPSGYKGATTKTDVQPSQFANHAAGGLRDGLPNMGPKRRRFQPFIPTSLWPGAPEGHLNPSAVRDDKTMAHKVAEDVLAEKGAKATHTDAFEAEREISKLYSDANVGKDSQTDRRVHEAARANGRRTTDALEEHHQRQLGSDVFNGPIASRPTSDPAGWGLPDQASAYWGEIDEAARRAAEDGDRSLLYASDPSSNVPRGYATPAEVQGMQRVFGVFLNKSANFSTLVHESAHTFLDILGELAERPDAPERTKRTWADALKWLGAENHAGITTEMHERFARGFEAYSLEGKPPAKGMRGMFNQMRRWMTKIYTSVRDLNVDLSPEIRSVFDRILATDEEIARAQKAQGPAVFANAAEAKMTPAQWDVYQAEQQDLLDEATEKARHLALSTAFREKEAWWKQALKKQLALSQAAFEDLPARKAQKMLQGELTGEAVVLDKAAVENIAPKGIPGVQTRVDGVDPDSVAALAGYPTGAAMLEAVATLPDRDGWVAKNADAQMSVLFPDVLDDRTQLRREVAKGMHGGEAQRRLLKEWAALTATGPKGSNIAPPVEALKKAAKLIVEQRALSNLNASVALAQERAAANAKAKAAAKGQTNVALEHARQQLLNMFLYRELLKAQDEREEAVDLAKELSKTKARAKLGKASPEYRNAADFLLGAVGLAPAAEGLDAATLPKAVAQMQGDAVVVGEPEWGPAVQAVLGKPWASLTVQQMRAVVDALKQLKAAANQRTQALVDDKREDRETVISAMLAEAGQTMPKLPPPATPGSQTLLERTGGLFNALDGFLLNPADMVRDLTGDNQESMWWKAVVLPLRRGKQREADLLKSTIKPITDAFEAMPKSVRANFMAKVDGAALFPTHTDTLAPPRHRYELLMMALNMGNEGNMLRLTEGRNITVAQVHRALDTLTADELAWVQTIWDAAESLRPEAFALEERDTGLKPEAVVATPLALRNGELRGGYFPAVGERLATEVGERQAAQDIAGLFDQDFRVMATGHGFLKSRSEGARYVISLDPRNIYAHLSKVVHDIAFREAVKSVGSLVMNAEVQQALKQRLGDGKAKQFKQWVQDVGQMRGQESGGWNTVQRWVRSNMAPALLGYSPSVAIGDLANIAASVPSTPLRTKHLGAGMMEYLSHPVDSRAFALEKSGELRFMQDEVKREFQKHMKSLTSSGVGRVLNNGPMGWWKEHAFAYMEGINVITATPIWLGSYRQALAEGLEDGAAVRFADDVLTRVFPSHSPVDQAGILRDKGFWGMSTVFYGYLSTAYRAQHSILRPLTTQAFTEAGLGEKAKTTAGVAGSLLAFYVAYQILGELLMGRGPEDGDDDDAEPGNKGLRWRNWFVRKMLSAPLNTVPVSDLGNSVEARIMHKPTNPRAAPLNAYFDLLGDAAEKVWRGKASTPDQLTALLAVTGQTLGVPVKPFTTTGKYLYDVATGDKQPENAGQFIGGVVYGERNKQPDNLPKVIGDALTQ